MTDHEKIKLLYSSETKEMSDKLEVALTNPPSCKRKVGSKEQITPPVESIWMTDEDIEALGIHPDEENSQELPSS